MRRRLPRWAAIVAISFGFPGGLHAQIFHVQAGSSSMMDAHGGSIDFQAPGYSGSFGAGMIDGKAEFGAVVRTSIHGFQLTAGDDVLPFNLPTDIFNGAHYFYGRGLGISGGRERFRFQFFAGATTTSMGAPYFSAARADQPFGLLFTQFKLRKNITLVTRSISAGKGTFIAGLEWSPNPSFAIASSGGVGANEPYFANSLKIERERVSFHAAYILQSNTFQRIGARIPVYSESNRENLLLTVRPTERFTFSIGRQNVLSPITSTQPSVRGLVHQFSASTSISGIRVNGSLYQSRVYGLQTLGYAVSGSRPFRRVEVGADFYRSTAHEAAANQSLNGRVRETITQKLALTQYVSRSNGQSSLQFGGEFTSNRLTIAVTHETVYAPFRPNSAGGPFVHVYNVSLRIRLFGSLEVAGHTNVTPDGKIRYTASTGDYFYRYAGLETGERPNLKIPDWVVQGKVVDTEGNPIAGAALQIDGKVAFSDSNGEFLVRFSKHEMVAFTVLLKEFLTAREYDVVSAPTSVESARENSARPVSVILQRITDQSRLHLNR
ncbi:MAG: hypothetical protein ACRD3E_00620 [Terriglobales bacterium]